MNFSIIIKLIFNLALMADISLSPNVGTRINELKLNNINSNYSFSIIRKFKVESNLTNLNFHKSQINFFQMKDFSGENLDFSFANIQGAKLIQVELENISFINANLKNVKFEDVIFTDCNFSFSDLRGAQFLNSHIGNSIFDGAIFDNDTKLPFSRSEAIKRGMILSTQRGNR